jgi:MFS family permease
LATPTDHWSSKDFRRVWAAQAGSALGSRVTRTALPILAILTIKASPTQVAILGALSVAPGVIVALFAGGIVDRSKKRPLLIASDLVRAALIFSVPAAAFAGVLGMAQLYLVAALVGAATTVFEIADRSFLPLLVEPASLPLANARLEATEAVAEAAGPGIGGLLIQWLTAPVALLLDGASYLWSALLLARVGTTETPPAAMDEPKPSVLNDIATGFAASAGHPVVGATLFAQGVCYLFGGFFLALYMVMTLQTLGLSPATVGLIISAGGVGSFGGALLSPWLGRRLGAGPAMLIGLAVGQVGNLLPALALAHPATAVPLLVGQQLIGDAFMTAFMIQSVSLRQRILPASVLGRANAAFHVIIGVALPLGALAAGPLAEAIGVRATIWIGALGGLAAVPFLLRPAILRLR